MTRLLPALALVLALPAGAQTFTFTGDDQATTISDDGTYRISVRGADGGGDGDSGEEESSGFGGSGAAVAASFDLEAGDRLTVVVGGAGAPGESGSGGGGGSAVVLDRGGERSLLLVAGAGGGRGDDSPPGQGGSSDDGTAGGGGTGDEGPGDAGSGGGFGEAGADGTGTSGEVDSKGGPGGQAGTLDGGGAGGVDPSPDFGTGSGGFGFGGGGSSDGQNFSGGGGGGFGGGRGAESSGGGGGGSSFVALGGVEVARTDGVDGGSQERDGEVVLARAATVDADLVVDTADDDQEYSFSSSRAECTDGVLDGDCTLREAIRVANATEGDLGTIGFEITEANGAVDGVATISPGSALPTIFGDGIVIDGYTQPGSAPATEATEAVFGIVLDGSNEAVTGLSVSGGGVTVRGLTVENYNSNAIVVDGSGTTVTGVLLRDNAPYGLVVTGPDSVIGGTSPDDANTIVGSDIDGIIVVDNSSGAVISGNTIGGNGGVGLVVNSQSVEIVGNFVGTNDGGGDIGNSSSGILLLESSEVVVRGNTIGNNGFTGIESNGSSDLRITSNFVGTNAAGDDVGNDVTGIWLQNGTQDVVVGGANPELDLGNTIAFNGGDGVLVQGANSAGNAIVGNRIVGNGGLGIDLEGGDEDGFGVTENDAGDGDGGPNDLQNYPVITRAVPTEAGADVTFELRTTPGGVYRVEVFASDDADPSGFGEGARRVASTTVRPDGSGDTGPVTLSIDDLEAGDVVTATATQTGEVLGGTSEFSQAVTVAPDVSVQFAEETATASEGETLDLEVTLSEPAPEGGVSVEVAFIGSDDPGAESADLGGFTSETVTFDQGETSQTVTVTATDDGAPEDAETFSFTLLDASGAEVGSPSGLTLTIAASAQTVTVAVAPSEVAVLEGETAFVTATLTTGDGQPLGADTPFTVSLVGDGSTADNDDFAPFAGEGAAFDGDFPETVTAPAGTPSGTVFQIPVPAEDDGVVEGDETADLRVTSDADGVTVSGGDVEVTIEDKPVVQFAAASATATEGSTVDLAVTLSVGAPEGGAAVDVVLLEDEDEATSAADLDGYQTQTATFAEGEQTATVTVTVTDDRAAEPAETFTFALRDAEGATVGAPDRFTLTVDESAQAVTLTVAEAAVTAREGAASTVTVTLTTGDGAPLGADTPFTVSLVGDGSTADNDDFAPATVGGVTFDGDFPETLVAPAGTPSGTAFTLPVPLEDDGVVEGDEVANLRVTSAGAAVVDGDVTLTIEDAPAVSFERDAVVTEEGDPVELRLVLDQPAAGGETVEVVFASGGPGADAGDIGGFTSETVTFDEGDLGATVAVDVPRDGRTEDDEAFTFGLQSPSGLGLGTPSETVLTVALSVATVALETSFYDAVEGDSVRVEVSLSEPAFGGETATLVLDDTSGPDATSDDLGGFESATVTFADGETTATVTVPVTRDGVAEGRETFTLVIEEADGLDVGEDETTITVAPSRTGVRFADAAFQVAEGATALLTLELGSPAAGGETVEVAFAGGTDGADLEDVGGFETRTVTFAAGDTTATVGVPVVEDGQTEDAESFTFRLQNATGLEVGTPAETVVTVDPSATTVSFGGQGDDGTVTVSEGVGTLVLEVEFGEPLAEDAAFDVVLASSSDDASGLDASAENGAGPEDFGGFESVTVEVEAGATAASVEIPVTDDSVAEGTERFEFEIQNATGGGPNGLALGDASVTVVVEDNDNPVASDASDVQASTIGRAFPNPTAGTAQIELSVDVPQRVRVTVVDAVGRAVQVVDLEVSGTERVEVGAGLAPGVYLVRVAGDTVSGTRRLTVAR